jgi:hypothetical protein
MEGKDEMKPETKNGKLYLGTGGTLGVISVLGACGGACSLAVFPLGTFLGAIGLGGLAVYLPMLRWPLMALAAALSIWVLRTVIQQRRPLKTVGIAILLLGSLIFAGMQAFKPTDCESQGGQIPQNLSPEMAAVFDPEMTKVCEMGCALKGRVDEKQIVNQPGAKEGDLVRCPVSGVAFRVKMDSLEIVFNGHSYFTCCPSCAARFEQKHKTKVEKVAQK